jgi:hypothetical protein
MSKMTCKAPARGTRANTLESVWCRRVSRKATTEDNARILLGTLRAILKDDPDRIVRDTMEIALGVRRRKGYGKQKRKVGRK